MIDAHHHLWDLDAVHYPWVAAKGQKRFFGQPYPIRKNHFVKNLLLVNNSKSHNVLKTLLVPFWVDNPITTLTLQRVNEESSFIVSECCSKLCLTEGFAGHKAQEDIL